MRVGSFNLEQDRDLEKQYNLLQGVGKFGSNNATEGEFGTTRLATKTKQILGASQVNYYYLFLSIMLFFTFIPFWCVS